MTQEKLVNKWIAELKEAGMSYDDMIIIFRLAGEKLKQKRCSHESHRDENGVCLKGPVEYKVCMDCGVDFDFKIIR
ncbi:MAG: hypothetical protein MH137_11265 [Flavobacteriales bacterium]|nr:hypothetical protein [Flavobacteriales bacterium]